MLDSVKHLLSENTYVLCLLNGLGHIDTLKEFVPKENILMGVTVLTAGMKGPGVFAVSNYGKTEIQNIDEKGKEKALEVVEAINNSGLPCEYSNDILFSIWRKACINGTMNCCCTLLECNMLQLGQTPNIRELLGTIVEEFAAVAKVEEAKDAAATKVAEAKEAVSAKVEEVKNAASEAKDAAANKAVEMKDAAADKAAEVKEAVTK